MIDQYVYRNELKQHAINMHVAGNTLYDIITDLEIKFQVEVPPCVVTSWFKYANDERKVP